MCSEHRWELKIDPVPHFVFPLITQTFMLSHAACLVSRSARLIKAKRKINDFRFSESASYDRIKRVDGFCGEASFSEASFWCCELV